MAKAKHNGHLQLDPRNARRHSERNKRAIRQSLEAVGGFRSIAVDGQNIIRAGNGVYEQAQELGLKVRVVDAKRDELIAVRRPDLKGKEAIRAAALDNLAADSSYADYDAEILAEIARDDELVAALAREDKAISALLNPGEMPTDADWAAAFEAGGNTANVDGLHTVSFTLASDDVARLREHLKKFSPNHNVALMEWLRISLSSDQ